MTKKSYDYIQYILGDGFVDPLPRSSFFAMFSLPLKKNNCDSKRLCEFYRYIN